MKIAIVVALLFCVTACSSNSSGNMGVDKDSIIDFQSINYDDFRGTSLKWRHGMFRGVVGEINGAFIVVGTTGRNDELINDSKTFPLTDSLRQCVDVYKEIQKRRFPLSQRDLELVRGFMASGLFALNVDEVGRISGSITPDIRFERTCSVPRIQELLDKGYIDVGNGFYVEKFLE